MYQDPAQHIYSGVSHPGNTLEYNMNICNQVISHPIPTQMTSYPIEDEYASIGYSSMAYQQSFPGTQIGDGYDGSLQGNNYASMTGQPSCTSTQTSLMMTDISILPTYMPEIDGGEGADGSQTRGGIAVGDGSHTWYR